jgi:hypothetical protein
MGYLTMIQRQNHHKKGSKIKVEPIRQMKDINNLKKLLADKLLEKTFNNQHAPGLKFNII